MEIKKKNMGFFSVARINMNLRINGPPVSESLRCEIRR